MAVNYCCSLTLKRWVKIAVVNYHSTLLQNFITMVKGVYAIQTFYHSNLPPFNGNTVILCYKPIKPSKLVWIGNKLRW